MQVVSNYQTRVLDQEPDAIAICPPPFQDHIVIGTYSLINGNSGDSEEATAPSRQGSLQIQPFTPSASSPDSRQECLVGQDFPFGVYDLHFHEQVKNLLGVATSDGRVFLFRLAGEELELRFVGWVMVEEGNIITQFTFLEDVSERDACDVVTFFATTQSGRVKGLRVNVPQISRVELDRTQACDLLGKGGELNSVVIAVHRHEEGFEAWTVSVIPNGTSDRVLLVSGGDDSRLIASNLDLDCFSRSHEVRITNGEEDEDEDEYRDGDEEEKPLGSPIFTERRTHQAGVVSLLHLGRLQGLGQDGSAADGAEDPELLLTGSYDEHIRLFTFPANAAPGARPRLQAEMKMPGGVWRITLLDTCSTNDTIDNANASSAAGREYVLLIAGHLGGAFIARLTQRPADSEDRFEWSFETEAELREGHESLVYACVARKQGEVRDATQWEIISSSFYDKRLCNWTWSDPRSR